MTTSNASQDGTVDAVYQARHEHAWLTESGHWTSDGRVLYVRCECGVRRIDRQDHPQGAPVAISRTLGDQAGES